LLRSRSNFTSGYLPALSVETPWHKAGLHIILRADMQEEHFTKAVRLWCKVGMLRECSLYICLACCPRTQGLVTHFAGSLAAADKHASASPYTSSVGRRWHRKHVGSSFSVAWRHCCCGEVFIAPLPSDDRVTQCLSWAMQFRGGGGINRGTWPSRLGESQKKQRQ
jgi:hypothetical protein